MVKYVFDSQRSYDVLKSLNMSELGGRIVFDDKTGSVTVEDEELFSILLDENMNIEGFDADYNPTARGREIESLIDEVAYMKSKGKYYG